MQHLEQLQDSDNLREKGKNEHVEEIKRRIRELAKSINLNEDQEENISDRKNGNLDPIEKRKDKKNDFSARPIISNPSGGTMPPEEYIKYMRDTFGHLIDSDGNEIPDGMKDFLGKPPKMEDLPNWIRTDTVPQKTSEGRAIGSEQEKKGKKLDNYFSIVPHRLLYDRSIPPLARDIFCALHGYCREKDLRKKPKTFVSLTTIANDLCRSERYVRTLVKILGEKGWLDRNNRRNGRTKETVLFFIPQKKSC